MQNDKAISNLLGLAMRAGKVECGTEKVLAGMKSGKYQLVILANDASDNTLEKFIRLAEQTGTSIMKWGTVDMLAGAIGKSITVAVGIKDSGFAKAIKKK